MGAYGVDFGTIWGSHMGLILVPLNGGSLSWSFWYLIILIPSSFSYDWRFSFEWGSCMGILNGGSEQGHMRLEWGPGILWGFWTGQSYGAVIWSWFWYHWIQLIMLIILIPSSFFDTWLIFLGAVWGTDGSCIVLCISASHQTQPCLGWPSWLQVKLNLPGW